MGNNSTTSIPQRRRKLTLAIKISLLGTLLLVFATTCLATLLIVQMRGELLTRAEASLDNNLRLLQQLLSDEGTAGSFSVRDDRLYVGSHAIDTADSAVDRVRRIIGGTATIFRGDTRVATNVIKPDGTRAVGTKLAPGPAYEAVLSRGVPYRGEVDVLGTPYLAHYEPIRDAAGTVIGILYVGVKLSDFLAGVDAALRQTVLIGLLVTLAAVGLLWLALRRALAPLTSLRVIMGHLSEGNLAVTVVGTQRTDEIGAMAAAVQVFKDNLVRARKLEEETALVRASAEEQRKRAIWAMADGFEAAVGSVIGMVSSSATELQATAQQMTTTAHETASQSTTVAAAAEEAATNVNTVAAAAEELGSSVQEIGRQVSGSAQLAQSAVGEADQTQHLVQALSQASARIGDMVGLISTIAGQTNLLALNATIEAARAGDAGRGFAVVAAEVKELAAQTARATEEISQQIGQIQGVTGQAVTAIETIASRIREIDGVATTIAAAVEEQGAATQEIVRNVSQAAQGAADVTSTITGVADAAKGTGAAADQVLTAASELSLRSGHLRDEVTRFLATVRAA